jgi:hypothetical protein
MKLNGQVKPKQLIEGLPRNKSNERVSSINIKAGNASLVNKVYPFRSFESKRIFPGSKPISHYLHDTFMKLLPGCVKFALTMWKL